MLLDEMREWYQSECVSHAKKFGSANDPDSGRILLSLGKLKGIEEAVNKLQMSLRKLEEKP